MSCIAVPSVIAVIFSNAVLEVVTFAAVKLNSESVSILALCISIVVTSVKSYRASKLNSEKAPA